MKFYTSMFLFFLYLFVTTTSWAQTVPQPSPGLENKLLATLASNATFEEKSAACRQLGVMGSDKAVPVLANLLTDSQLSHMARYALETIPGPAATAACRSALKTCQDLQLVGVIGSVGFLRDTQAVPLLTPLLTHSDQRVRKATYRALGSIGNQAAVKALQEVLDHTPKVEREDLYEGLLHGAEHQAAVGNTEFALPIYQSLNTSQVPFPVRSAAIRGIIALQGSTNPEFLLQCLSDTDPTCFAAAVQAGSILPGAHITKLLAQALDKQTLNHRLLLLKVLGHRVDEVALPSLHHVARQGESLERQTAIAALTSIGHDSSISLLVSLIEDADSQVAEAAINSLGTFPHDGGGAIETLLASPKTSERLIGMRLASLQRLKTCLPKLLEAAQESNPQLHQQALSNLAELGGAQEIPPLLTILKNTDDPKTMESLRKTLTDICVRVADQQHCTGLLVQALTESTLIQKTVLLRILSSIRGPVALQAVQSYLNDADADLHLTAVRALSSWQDTEAAPALLELIRTSDTKRDRILGLRGYLRLATQGEFSKQERLDMCRQVHPLLQNSGEKKLWLSSVGRIDSVSALTLLLPGLDDAAFKETTAGISLSLIERMAKKNRQSTNHKIVQQAIKKIQAVTTNPDYRERAQRLQIP